MPGTLEIRGDHIIWHRTRPGGRSAWWKSRIGQLSAERCFALEGSFGRDIYLVVSRRVRICAWLVLCFLVSLKFYLVRELVAGFIILSAFSAALLIPLSLLFAVYKAGQHLAGREPFRSMRMNKIIKFPAKDRQLDEFLARLAAKKNHSLVLVPDPQKAAPRNGLILITASAPRAR